MNNEDTAALKALIADYNPDDNFWITIGFREAIFYRDHKERFKLIYKPLESTEGMEVSDE